jgi:MYXO-CTERM domain-containing protein/CSLREA domain-containing protein
MRQPPPAEVNGSLPGSSGQRYMRGMNTHSSRSLSHPLHRGRFALYAMPLMIVGLAPLVAEAAEIQVDTTADLIDSNGDCSLREAVIAANTNTAVDGCVAGEAGLDTIVVPAGTYTLSLTGIDEASQPDGGGGYEVDVAADASVGDLDIVEDLVIVGAGAATTVIDWANDEDRIFHIQAPTADVTATISGLTLQGGQVAATILNPEDPEADHWSFARHGGAIALGVGASAQLASASGQGDDGNAEEEEPNGTATLILSDCVLTNHEAGGDGGALYAAGLVTVTGVTFSSNTAGGNGGAIYNDGEASYHACLITENHGENGGGMFDTGAHETSITGTTFALNTAVGGAGMASRSLVDTTLVNCTFSGNDAADIGGGILTNGDVELISSTITGNIARTDAGFASSGLTSFSSGSFVVLSSIVANNLIGAEASTVSNCGCTGGTCTTDITSDGFNLEDIDSCGFAEASDQVDTDPLLMALGSYGGPVSTHALMAESPALDVGSVETCPDTDARGLARPEGAGCDIGAFELAPDELDGDDDGYCVGVMFDDALVCLDGSTPGDCDGSNPAAFPGNPEVCDGADNDCNGMIDDGLETFEFWPDADGDGFGDANAEPISACAAPDGYVDDASDCDDTAAGINPDAEEICDNGIDDNCDGLVDGDDPSCATGDGDGDPTGDGDGDPTGDGDGDPTGDGDGDPTGDGDGDGTGDTGGDVEVDGEDGCNCATEPKRGGHGWLALLGLGGLGLIRRRRG